jgi:GNAT superfamily N-acetyltransferase
VKIESADPKDALDVSRFCQPIYQAIYPNRKYDLAASCFDPWVFETVETLDYFRKVLETNDHQVAYVAREDNQIIGTISIIRYDDHYEIRCFYVDEKLQGQGIGKQLWAKAMEFYDASLPLRVMVADTHKAGRRLYEKWGFHEREDLGVTTFHWPEWPKGQLNGYVWYEK